MKISTLFTKDQIVFIDGSQKQQAIRQLVSKLNDIGKIKSTPRYYAQVIHRESLENTGIGHGFAIPHARTDSVDNINIVFGICPEGMDYQSFDGKPVKYLMLAIFPTSLSTQYLYIVSMFASIFKDEKKLKILNSLDNVDEVYELLKDNAEHFFDNIAVTDNDHVDESANLAGVPSSDLDLLIKLDRLYKNNEEKDSDSIKQKIEQVRDLIDNRSLTYYDRMHSKCENPFAIVEKNACSGCHMNIPPIEINEIKKRTSISICSHCGRFLIFL